VVCSYTFYTRVYHSRLWYNLLVFSVIFDALRFADEDTVKWKAKPTATGEKRQAEWRIQGDGQVLAPPVEVLKFSPLSFLRNRGSASK